MSSSHNLLVYMTHLCNYTCEYCCGVVDYKNKTMNFNYKNMFVNVDKVTEFIKTHQYSHVFLHGGEPTLHPKLVQLCKNIYQLGKKVSIETNLSKDIAYYNQLVDIGVEIIATYHLQNTQFVDKLHKIKEVDYTIVMANNKYIDKCISIYEQIKCISKHMMLLDNVKYTEEQLVKLSPFLIRKFPYNFNNMNVITSAGCLYENDNCFVNGTNEDDCTENIIEYI